MAEESNPSSDGNLPKDKGKGKQVAVDDSTAEEPKQKMEKTDPKDVERMLKSLGLGDMLAGAVDGSGEKDIAKHKFWKTQPVLNFDDVKKQIPRKEEGPIKQVDISKVPKEPPPLPGGYEWVTMDLTSDTEVHELYELLSNHYVEDNAATFRFNYSSEFLNWALKAPGWRRDWHIGVRVSKTQKLIGFISGIPINLRVRGNTFRSAEVNYLCIHKKLRDKRLAPVLIGEVTRRFNLDGIFQAIYTIGAILPSPVATCRYFHRALDFDKLCDIGFSAVPVGSSKMRQNLRYKLPTTTATAGLRPMEEKDIKPVAALLKKYLARFDMAQDFSAEDMDHWFIHKDGRGSQQVVWTWVVESKGKITDFFSFYRLESTVIKATSPKNKILKAAYLWYYATDVAFGKESAKLKDRLNDLMKDALILAKKNQFDVLNALSLLDNPLFLEDSKFGQGDGKLHYYLYNYRASPIAGGLDDKLKLDTKKMGGVGMIMI